MIFGIGSIGSELARQLPDNELFLFDHEETAVFDLAEELRNKGYKVKYQIGDIRNEKEVRDAIESFNPDIIYMCAALKHVTPCEEYPRNAVLTNIIGTQNVLESSGEAKFIFISTDKVHGTSIMGATKRMAEALVKNKGGVIVRFANVLGSRGSVIPLWQAQMDRGEPLTVTDDKMTRYFMSIRDAVELVRYAGEHGKPKETWVMNMGEPVNILKIAEEILRKSGSRVGIKIIGSRPGETLSETLITEEEKAKATEIGSFWVFK